MKSTLFTIALLAISQMAAAKDIKGQVTDASTGEPLVGVHVEAYGNNQYTAITDKDGRYTITVPDFTTSLYIYREGKSPLMMAIGKDNANCNAELFSDAFSKTYDRLASANRRTVADGLDYSVEVSADPFISQQLAADVRTISRGGMEGVGNTMFIGGLNSLNVNAQPLIVIDGVWMDMQYDRTMLHDGYYNNILANIDVNDIETVEVLKNGTALYGAKGANGVILITTKRNKSMTTKIDVNIGGKFIWQPRTASMMNADDYRTYATELLSGEMTNISSMKFLVDDPSYYYYNMYHNNTDWKSEVYDNAFAQTYGINVQGGDNVASYNLAVGYTKADTPLKGNDYSRFNMRLNTDIEVVRNLSVRFDASFSDVDRSLRDVGIASDVENTTATSPNFLALIKAPFLSPYAYDVNGNLSQYLAEADDYLEGNFTTSDYSLANPVSIIENGDGENRNSFGNRLVMFSVTPQYKIGDHLTIEEAFNFSLVNTNENYYLPITGMPSFRVPDITDIVWVNNVVKSLAARQNTIQSDTRVTWNNRFGAHSIKAFGGVRYNSNSYKLNIQQGYNTANDKTPNISTSLIYKSTDGADDKSRDITWYVAGDYNYAEKLYLTANLTAQTSSRFGDEADGLKAFGTVWGIFPGIQASYVMTNDTWFPKNNNVNMLRINAGYDVTGNDNIDYTASRTYYVAKTMLGNTVDGKVLENVGNDLLKWETTKRANVGIEGNFLGNRLHIALNAYKSWTSDLLTLSNIAWASGVSEMWTNDGKLENKGLDLNISAKLLAKKNFQWEIGASLGTYKNKVTALSNNNEAVESTIYGATVLTQVGSPVGVFYGYTTEGVFSTQAEADEANLYMLDDTGEKVYFQAGDMHFTDRDGNGVIDENDRTIIGDPNPDIYGNIYTHLKWKRWAFDARFTYSLGNDVFNYERSILESGKYFYNQTTAMTKRWTTEGQVTDIPRASYLDEHGNSRFSDRWIEDGSYLRLANVTISYSIPIDWIFVQGLTLWASGQNLFTITKYLGSNPDTSLSGSVLSQGIDRGIMGSGRSFSFGMKLNL